jgi:uncharacterized protein
MRIELEKLEESGGKFSRIYQLDELPLEDTELRLVEPSEIHGRIRRKGAEVELRGELRAKVAAPCGRCLKPVELVIQSKFAERFVPAVSWGAEAQHELTEEDLNLSVFDGEAIELDDLVREEILLETPGHVLCGENCKGLCPVCGIDRNLGNCQCDTSEVDSRWQNLKELQM